MTNQFYPKHLGRELLPADKRGLPCRARRFSAADTCVATRDSPVSVFAPSDAAVCFRIIVKSGKEMQPFSHNPAGFVDKWMFRPLPPVISRF